MPRLMHAAEQRRQGIILLIASSNADIVDTERGFEGVRRLVLPSAVPVVTELGDDLYAKINQLLFVVFFIQEIILDLFAFGNILKQLDLFRAQAIEDCLYIGGLHARLVIIQQRIIWMIRRREE